jgi:hypothetical protein
MPRRSIWAVTILCALTGAAPPLRAEPPSLFSGGDGLSKEHAVVIHAKREDDGNKVEYIWIRQNHPGVKVERQSLISVDGRPYDCFDVVATDGSRQKYYFDISEYFGKLD